ncbi:MAG: hypothetical protein IPO66_20095 [Rhodanobacteraceae bacterium]|nr:hypothetical protein [Rhodanobacteraceae bacterium]
MSSTRALPETTSFVVLQFGDDHYSFNRVQCQALQVHYQNLADKRAAAASSAIYCC